VMGTASHFIAAPREAPFGGVPNPDEKIP
jgi:hypothetical protein